MSRTRSDKTTVALDQAMNALRGVVAPGSLRGISEAFALFYERLPDPVKTASRLIGWLAPAPLPYALIQALGKPFDPSVQTMLVGRSFITESARTEVETFGSMHRVLGDFLQHQSSDPTGELTRLTVALLTVMSKERMDNPSEWRLVETCEPHAATLLGHVAALQPRTERVIDQTAMLALALVTWFSRQGFPATAADLGLAALAACSLETEPGKYAVVYSAGVRRLFQKLRPVLAESGQYDAAEELYRSYVEWLQQNSDKEDPEVLAESDNLANMLRERARPEDLKEAQEIFEGTIPAWQRRDRDLRARGTLKTPLSLAER